MKDYATWMKTCFEICEHWIDYLSMHDLCSYLLLVHVWLVYLIFYQNVHDLCSWPVTGVWSVECDLRCAVWPYWNVTCEVWPYLNVTCAVWPYRNVTCAVWLYWNVTCAGAPEERGEARGWEEGSGGGEATAADHRQVQHKSTGQVYSRQHQHQC